MTYKGICGVGGNRTLVQTSDEIAFYRFSFQLIFDNILTENGPNITYLFYFKTLPKP